ncbi:Protein vip1 [Elasticomyces elasticus]|nr:Protein vip1 [Elasticomyces elasticus]KAK5001131.1 Protein vip1 [Elasticomyces elasticus]
MSNTVHVKNISSQTSEKEVRDFFSFCGKISSLSVTRTSDSADSTQSATVTFEKETAAKTALLLDSTQLGPAQVHVSSAASLDQMSGGKSAGSADEHGEDIAQEDKPRSRIVAEYLAHGYVISDKAIERAIALDNQHGISNRFMNALTNFDSKFKATEKAQAVDQKYGVTDKAYSGWRGLNSYFDKAMGTPTGQKVRQFYSVGNKQVIDVHNEARHLANLKSGKNETTPVGDGKTKCNCGADMGKCPCAPGKCACANCPKNSESGSKIDPESAGMEQIDAEGHTRCNCGGDTGKCPCPAGKCACASCPKNAS